MSSGRVALVFPKLGMSGFLVRHLPLNLLYASVGARKAGFEIDIVDARLFGETWQNELRSRIHSDTVLIGISVMTGTPIKNALEISRWVKVEFPETPVVWGGPHATFNGNEILREPAVDFVISGYGSKPLSELAKHLRKDKDALPCSLIAGLSYRADGKIVTIPPLNEFEKIDYRDIPYDLIEHNLEGYGQFDSEEKIFSMYSAMGCPYRCSFCSSPAQYKDIKKKYLPLTPEEVTDHIEYVIDKYNATYIYFIDDDSFVNLHHIEGIMDEIRKRNIKVKLGFRGARINEIKKMSDEFLVNLSHAGTNILHIGAESGSQRILDIIRKDCTVQDIIDINKKLARHKNIKAAYNWLVGIPGETLEDLKDTQRLMLKLYEDNPNAIIFTPNKLRPIPGTELYDLAVDYGYRTPKILEEWINIEAEGDYTPVWYTKEISSMINMMRITSFFIDKKLFTIDTGYTLKYMLLRLIARVYGPIAKFRAKNCYTGLLIEFRIYNWLVSLFR